MYNLKEMLNEYNTKFKHNDGDGIIDKTKKSYEFKIGSTPILLSAPHSVKQLREGKPKIQDSLTGPIAEVLADLTKCSCIYRIYNEGSDPNYYNEDGGYKKEIERIISENNIKLLIDLHGAKNRDEFNIDVGTNNGINLNGKLELPKLLIKSLEENGVKNIKQDYLFKASKHYNVSKTIAERTKIPCMQVEIALKYRDLEQFENVEKVIKGLQEFILEVSR